MSYLSTAQVRVLTSLSEGPKTLDELSFSIGQRGTYGLTTILTALRNMGYVSDWSDYDEPRQITEAGRAALQSKGGKDG